MNQLLPGFILSVFLSVFSNAKAATFIVQNVNDSGTGSLREAITNSQDGDVIRFNPNLLTGGNNTIVLSSYLLVTKPIIIKGLYNQNDTLYISGNNATQIMVATLSAPTAPNSSLILDSLVFINALNTNYLGAAIIYEDVYGGNSLIVRNCSFWNNNSTVGGGAIGCHSYFKPQTIRLEHSIIRNCTGGGIVLSSYFTTNLTIVDSEIFNNEGGGVGSSSEVESNIVVEGSSIYNNMGRGIASSSLARSVVTVTNTTLYGNIVQQAPGGAIFSYVSSNPSPTSISSVTLNNCTITGNSATYIGGVYSFCYNESFLKITNSTIVENINAGIHSESNGISSEIIKSSIIALNTGWDIGNVSNNVPSNFTSGGFNIFGVIPGGSSASDQLNATAAQLNLGSLQFNGGNTKTRLPGSGSIAIDMGNPTDLSDAQNAPLTGTIRDVGAAEVCSTTHGDTLVSTCGPFTWFGTLYNTSGNYIHYLMNVGGCDSIVTLHLTINTPSTGTDVQTACGSYTWNGQTYTSSGSYSQTLTNAAGCDSTVTLDLTVLPVFQTTETALSCGPYTWALNGQVYAFPGIFKDTLTGVNGCDSIVQLNLSILSAPTSDYVDNGNGTFTAVYSGFLQWINCVTGTVVFGGQTFAPQQNGTYALVAADGASCSDTSDCFLVDNLSIDSKDALFLSIFPNPTKNQVNISFSGSDAELTVYDVQGKVILKDRVQNNGTISLTEFERGTYLFDLTNAQGRTVQRVVKQ